MSTTVSGANRSQILAGQKAAFTKTLQSYSMTEDEDKKRYQQYGTWQITAIVPAVPGTPGYRERRQSHATSSQHSTPQNMAT
jgi:hypothetical protein